MDDKVVYLNGRAPSPEQTKDDDDAAVRSILTDTLKDYRAGKIRAVVVIAIEKESALCWRVGGNFSEAEIIGSLETVKLNFMVSD
jgi:hypothetical protein